MRHNDLLSLVIRACDWQSVHCKEPVGSGVDMSLVEIGLKALTLLWQRLPQRPSVETTFGSTCSNSSTQDHHLEVIIIQGFSQKHATTSPGTAATAWHKLGWPLDSWQQWAILQNPGKWWTKWHWTEFKPSFCFFFETKHTNDLCQLLNIKYPNLGHQRFGARQDNVVRFCFSLPPTKSQTRFFSSGLSHGHLFLKRSGLQVKKVRKGRLSSPGGICKRWVSWPKRHKHHRNNKEKTVEAMRASGHWRQNKLVQKTKKEVT